MYFEHDKILDNAKLKEGQEKFEKVPKDEKNNYIKDLFFALRQQAFYAGLGPIHTAKLFKKLADSEKENILDEMGYSDDDSEKSSSMFTKCSSSELKDILSTLLDLKDKCEKEDSNLN